jgi:hypothetical protein
MTAGSEREVIALEMAERIFGLSPPPLISADGTQTTTEHVVLVTVEKDPEHLARSTAVVLARLVPRHAASQGIDRYTACKDVPQEADCRWITSFCDTACLDQLHVWRVVGRGAGRLAEADPCVRVHRHCPSSRWTVRWLQRWIGRALFVGVVGGRAGPKVSLVLNDGAVPVVLTCTRVQPPWLPWLVGWAPEPLARRSAEVVAGRWGPIDGDSARDLVHSDRAHAP